MKYILSLDQGTTSSRAILFDHAGAIHATAQEEFRQIFPQAGWVEHDPEEIWTSQYRVARQALEKAGCTGADLAAIGLTNQRETTLVWDRRTGEPVYNAIVWQDRRTANICSRLQQRGLAPLFKRKTGLIIDPYFAGTKIAWLLEQTPGLRQRAERGELAFGTVDTWLIWKLTAGRLHLTDATNASRTLLFNIHTGEWDDELLEVLEIPREMLPEVRASSEVYGETEPTLFGEAVPIAGIAGDQQASLFGQMCTQAGMVKNTYGTGCFVVLYTGDEAITSEHNLLTTVARKINAKLTYALEGSIFVAGAAVQWLRDGLGLISGSDEIEALAGQVDHTDGVYFVPAFTGLGAPHWDAYARGAIIGITRGTQPAHIARATLESIAHQTVDVVEAMVADSGLEIAELRADGGASRNNLLMQMQADLLQTPVVCAKVAETTALGTAYLAGLAVGYWQDEKEIATQWQAQRRFEPALKQSDVRAQRMRWQEALRRARNWEKPLE